MSIPNIEYKRGMWNGTVRLEAWNQFFQKEGLFELNIGGDMQIREVNIIHEATYQYLLDNEMEILYRILERLVKDYPRMQEESGYEEDELKEYMPDVNCTEDFKRLIVPKRIYILNVDKEGYAYIGIHFWCLWDEEQELGVMIYKERIVQIGGADVAFMSWIAEEDKMNGVV